MLPGLFFLALVVAAGLAVPLWTWRRRTLAYRALAEEFGLRDARSDNYAPDPQISGVFLSASYPRFLMGTLDGVRVVAFDYRIGWGRGMRLGAGVGVAAPVDLRLLLPQLRSALDASQHDGWTFCFTTPSPFARIGYGMEPSEMEDLWRKLLQTPNFLRAEPLRGPSPEAASPGELHIRPRHPEPPP